MAQRITHEDFLLSQAVQLIQMRMQMEKELEKLRAKRPIWRLIEKETRNEEATSRTTRR